MPVHHRGRGCYQWGRHGKVYCGLGARGKAERQGQAAFAGGYRSAELAPVRRGATGETLYHVTHPSNQDSIQTRGLLRRHSLWHERGIFLSQRPTLRQLRASGHDLWAVDVSGLDLYEDFTTPGIGESYVVYADIAPSRLRLAHRGTGKMVVSEETSPLADLIEATLARYPVSGESVGELRVRAHVPNLSSIDGYFAESETLPGVRAVPLSDFGGPRTLFYAADDFKRSERLADAIRESGEINPLIVGVDEKGPFIIEGAHRFVALWYLKAEEFPAVVVVGRD